MLSNRVVATMVLDVMVMGDGWLSGCVVSVIV